MEEFRFEPTSKIENLIGITAWTFATAFAFLFLFGATGNIFIALGATLPVSLSIITLFYLTSSIIIFTRSGILIKSKLQEKLISWNDVISMSTVVYSDWLHYQIKTTKGTVTVKTPRDWENLESFLVQAASLELEDEGPLPVLFTHGQSLKRWKRKGGEYEFTGLADRIAVGYLKNFRRNGIIFGILFMLVLAFFVYLLIRGY